MMTKVFNAKDTAPLALEAILKAGSFDLGPKAGRIEDPAEWTEAKIVERRRRWAVTRAPKGISTTRCRSTRTARRKAGSITAGSSS